MKGKYTMLKDLTDKSRDFKIKVKVIQKARPIKSTTVKYQRIKFADEEGNGIRGTLFDDDIRKFELALQQGGEYEISNVPIHRVPEQYCIMPNEFQINFNDRVKIIQINQDNAQLLPKYHNILTILQNAKPTDLIAVIGVVLFVEETKTIKLGDREQQVREILLTDNSVERPLVLSLWDDLARTDSEQLNEWAESFMIVGFTDMQISKHKGLSLRSSMSTSIIIDPEDMRAQALKKWIAEKETTIVDRRSKAMEVKFPSHERVITTMAEIVAKKVDMTWQEEKFWTKATIPEADIQNVQSYLGCVTCGRKSEAGEGLTDKCLFCNTKDSIYIPRVNFTFEATDGTETLKFTIFNDHVEQLFGLKCEEIIKLKNVEESEIIQEVVQQLRSKAFFFEVGPTSSLLTSQILKWAVCSISHE